MILLPFHDFTCILFRGADHIRRSPTGRLEYIFLSHSKEQLSRMVMHYTHVANLYSEYLKQSIFGTVDVIYGADESIIVVDMSGELATPQSITIESILTRMRSYRKLFTRTGKGYVERNLMELFRLKHSKVTATVNRTNHLIRVRTRCSTGNFAFERKIFGVMLRVLETTGYEMESERVTTMCIEFRADCANDRKRLMASFNE